MRQLFFILFFFSSNITTGQDNTHASIWLDEYNIQHHVTHYLSNYAGQKEYLRHWNDSVQSFVSSIPDYLTYKPAANKSLHVDRYEIEYRDDYQLLKWELFSPERFDSIIEKNKVIGTANLKYDEKGRLISSQILTKEHKLVQDRKTYSFEYSELKGSSKIRFNLNSKVFYWFARYQSSYAGNFMYRPLRLRSNWTIDYTFDEKRRMIVAEEFNKAKANQREATAPAHRFYHAIWDEKGHLLQRCYRSINDSVEKLTEQQFREKPFDLALERKNYSVLKTPSIERWLMDKSLEGKLKLVDYSGQQYPGVYIVDKNEQPLILLGKTDNSRKIIFQTLVDSNSTYRSEFDFRKLPDTTDKIPYDPHYKRQNLGTRYTQCSVITTYSSPPGMIHGNGTDGYKKSFKPLNDGWTLIMYENGSSDNNTSSFAIGHKPLVRLDILNTKYVILDPDGRIRYFGSYGKMAKVNW